MPNIEAVPAEGAVRGVNSYLRWLQLADEASRNYTQEGRSYSNEKKLSVRNALESLYSAGSNEEKLLEFREHWGEEAPLLQKLYQQLTDRIEEERARKTAKIGPIEAIKTAVLASRRMSHLRPDQRSELFQRAGYNAGEALEMSKKVALSAFLNSAEYAIFLAGTSAAVVFAAANPLFPEIDDNTKYIVISSYLAKYSASWLNCRQSVRLLNDQNIGNSPNIISTGTYYLMEKFLPGRERVRNFGATAAPLLFNQDIFWAFTAALPTVGLSILTARNISATGFNLLSAASKEAWLRLKGSKNRKEEVLVSEQIKIS